MGETPLEGLSQEELEQRLAHALLVGDDAVAGDVETRLAERLLDAGNLAGARRRGERAVALQRRSSDAVDGGLARALAVYGHAAGAAGEVDAATGAYLEAIDLEGRSGRRDAVAGLLNALGSLAATSGDRGRARDLLAAALRTAPEAREDGARRAELGLARLELEDGDDASAARRALRVLQGGATEDLALQGALLLRDAGQAALARGEAEAARRRFEFALPVMRQRAEPGARAGLLGDLARACRRSGDRAAARAHYEEAALAARELDDAPAAAELCASLLFELGEMCLLETGDPAAAAEHLAGALVASETAGSLDRSVAVAGRLHQAARAAGDTAGAERWRRALARLTFAAAVAREAEALRADTPAATVVYGDTGARPRTLHIPGHRVSDGLLWRRRLGAEVKRSAPLQRVAVVRGGLQARVEPGVRPRDVAPDAARWMFLVERDGVEVRVATVHREDGRLRCGPWLITDEPGWPGSRDGLVEALRAALG